VRRRVAGVQHAAAGQDEPGVQDPVRELLGICAAIGDSAPLISTSSLPPSACS
jgi:hypothetical protein